MIESKNLCQIPRHPHWQ